MKSKKAKINKYTINDNAKLEDSIAIESPLEIRLSHDASNFQTLAITLCTPADIEDLIYGQLYTEGIITSCLDVKAITIYDNELGIVAEIILAKSISYKKYLNNRHGMIHASCGLCGKTEIDDLLTFKYPKLNTIGQFKNKLNAEIICSLPDKLLQSQQGFVQTGGLHASALFDDSGCLLMLKEDIGRHNALDKLIGYCLQQNLLPLSDKIILLSGRVSFELVHKSLCAGVTTLAAIGAPSSLSVEVAQLNNLQLLGFVKKSGFNRY
jgi:FdhD protein